MSFFTSYLGSLLKVKGNKQQLYFDEKEPTTGFKLKSNFQPTDQSSALINNDFSDVNEKGFRHSLITNKDENPQYFLSGISPENLGENSKIKAEPLLGYNENQEGEFKFHRPLNIPTPTKPSHAVNVDYLDNSLAPYVKNDSLPNILAPYITNSSLTTTLSTYATKSYVDTSISQTIEADIFTPILYSTNGVSKGGGKGYYVQIGRLVFLNIEFPANFVIISDSSPLYVRGIPFPSNNPLPLICTNVYEDYGVGYLNAYLSYSGNLYTGYQLKGWREDTLEDLTFEKLGYANYMAVRTSFYYSNSPFGKKT